MSDFKGGASINGFPVLHSGLSSAYLTGTLNISGIATLTGGAYVVNTNTYLGQGDGNSLRVSTNSGYIDVGAQNTSYAHIYTDRGAFYFNKDIQTAGNIYTAGVAATETSGVPSSIVKRDANGYIQNTWYNSSRASQNTTAASYIYDSGDGYMRKKDLANVKAEIVSSMFTQTVSSSETTMGCSEGTWFLPNGYMIKFGWFAIAANSARTYSYPTAFPNNTLMAQVTAGRNSTLNDAYTWVMCYSFNKTSIIVGNTGSGQIQAFYWVLGY
ncbi:MAG TPA: hypothetical protein VK190_03030 [Pseudoneobacillus sp.]|jgi:hypothetical protein|nr:hypothetical protein [Pseudoneobacillus sp.]